MASGEERKPFLSDRLSRPSLLLWVMLLPQVVLLLINLDFWSLIKGEMSVDQKVIAYLIVGSEAILLMLGILCIAALQPVRKKLELIPCGILLIAHIAYLWLVTVLLDKAMPSSVTVWILQPDEVLYYQFVLMMPAIFYTALRLACMKLPLRWGIDLAVTFIILMAVPSLGYVFLMAASMLTGLMHDDGIPVLVLFVGLTLVTMLAFLRVMAFAYTWLNEHKAGRTILLVAVGLVCPIAGLILNSGIPFPYDFQSASVYVMTLVNGIVLLLHFREGSRKEILTWFLRCLMYPFSLYFFLVFLPFLPLSLLAMIACGSGVLILAPTALFIVHTRRLIEEGRHAATLLGRTTTVLLFVAGFAVIPTIITVEAVSDKHALMRAVDAVYSPDYTADKVNIDPVSVKRSLLKLRDMKDGIYLPFLSPYYDKIVFNGMVLPDAKMNEIYATFVGEDMPKKEDHERFDFSQRRNFRNTPVQMPERTVEVADVRTTRRVEGSFVKADVQLILVNRGAPASEFVCDIELEQGVLVSGYWLKVNDANVPGLIFEKKAAMWVYHMIRDMTRRDPGILVYRSDNLLRLSVYPFESGQVRRTGIELMYPVGMRPFVRIGDRQIDIEADVAAPSQPMLVRTGTRSGIAVLPPSVLGDMPAVTRTPYLHFIIDGSAVGEKSFTSFGRQMAQIAAQYPAATTCRITMANYESFDITERPVNIADVERVMATAVPGPFRGAFCYERAIKKELLAYGSSSAKSLEAILSVPVFVVLTAPGPTVPAASEMSPFERFVPDVPAFYIVDSYDCMTARRYSTPQGYAVTSIDDPSPVVILASGNSFVACRKGTQWGFASLPDDDGTLRAYNIATSSYLPTGNIQQIQSDSQYARGLTAWDKYLSTVYHPSTATQELPGIVSLSRDCAIMTPLTSYIVLENSAQIEMLRRKEKQGLAANRALQFDEYMESPAPSLVFLIPVAVLLLMIPRKWLQKAGYGPVSRRQ